jgi:methylated-DNA-[protein]-cysteine S-methyltransferase
MRIIPGDAMSPLSIPASARQAWYPRQDYQAVMATSLPGGGARLGVRVEADGLRAIDVLPGPPPERVPTDDLAAEVVRQLEAYFADPRHSFDLPLSLHGTAYQCRVWQGLREIAPGERSTYGELAIRVGGSPRAVGNACRQNPLPVVIPCHRVVARTGLGGYMGEQDGTAMAIKRWLLAHEGGGDSAFPV